MTRRQFSVSSPRARRLLGPAALLCALALGCGGGGTGTSDPEAKLRLERLLEVYQTFASRQPQGKGPPDEQALKDFVKKLPREEQDRLKVGDDVEAALLTSPRDGQKFEVRYGLALDPAAETRAVAWEKTGKNGKRYVALSMGYVEEYEEEGFQALKK